MRILDELINRAARRLRLGLAHSNANFIIENEEGLRMVKPKATDHLLPPK